MQQQRMAWCCSSPRTCQDAALQCRAASFADDLSAPWREAAKLPDAELQAQAAIAAQRADAARTGATRLVTADQPGFEGLYGAELQNERVPVATAAPADSWDWNSR